MSMQSWGYSEILLDMTKAKKVAQKEYNIMELLIKEEDPETQDIESGDDLSKELSNAIGDFMNKVLLELEIDIYPKYISSEAEGTDYAGEIIWCIEPEYQPQIHYAMYGIESWSEFS